MIFFRLPSGISYLLVFILFGLFLCHRYLLFENLDIGVKSEDSMAVKCTKCKKTFTLQKNLNRHLENVHKSEQAPIPFAENSSKYQCVHCKCSYRQNKDLLYHLSSEHDFQLETENLCFESFSDFLDWKCNVEKEEKCNYVIARGKVKNRNGEIVQKYICNRTGVASRNNKNIKFQRQLKSQGSCKLNRACISEIKMVKDADEKVSVTRIKNHYGHNAEIQHTRISKQERASIATKLMNGASKIKILDIYRTDIGSQLKRIDLLTKKDINNIQRSFKLDISEGIKHENDAISIDLWVEEANMLKEGDPVLFYKKQDEVMSSFNMSDFCLILMNSYQRKMLIEFGNNIVCVDSTHGLNNYDFEMTTLMIVDNFGEGFPVAYMFTNRKDAEIHSIFFDKIKSKVGIINCKTFMSDITHVFYNAWVATMGSATYQIYCAWHIDRAWQVNLSKISNKEKRNWVYKTLKVLQYTSDCEIFVKHLQSVIVKLLEDNETHNFGIYFQNNYADNYRQWATSFRKSCGINTNMRVESMHKIIKYFYLDKKHVKRLDKGLHAVLKYTRDKIVDRVIKLTKGKNTIHRSEIIQRHKSALESSFDVELNCENKWNIKENNQIIVYNVEKLTDIKCCNLNCEFCQICVHMYACSCSDYLVKYTICKHIHFIAFDNIAETKDEGDAVNLISQEINDCVSSIGNAQQTSGLKEEIRLRLNNIYSNLDNKSDAVLKQLNCLLKTGVALLNTEEGNQQFVETASSNVAKNVIPQNRFRSTRKRRIPKKERLKKPDAEEINTLVDALNNKPPLIISKNSALDHNYLN